MKIAVVGSNTIGAYIARKLSESGNSVDLFERKPHIGKEACSGLFSDRIWKYFPEKVSIVKNTITSATVHFSKKTMKLELSPKMLVFHRGDFDAYATELAVKAGTKLHLGAFAKLKSQGKNNIILDIGGEEMEFDYLIACDGSVSTIR
ncbi:MAG TPA: NAD(P)-binding protein, partial [archaeon]|nr:NAD(P)-binding protein [archaeon]